MSSRKNLSDEIYLAAPVVVTAEEKIAYQGIKGANSYEAAQRLFPESDLVAHKSFDDVFKAVENGECGYGVLPVGILQRVPSRRFTTLSCAIAFISSAPWIC